MRLFIAGGVGEHGRNCFLVQCESLRFMVDCGKMANTPEDPYPRLTPEQISGVDAVFLTHSHADHTGALTWLYENGFSGTVIATKETLNQLPQAVAGSRALDSLCSNGAGFIEHISVQWGRSGHCPGSVWYRFCENEKAILFSGDYTEHAQLYACDPIRGISADLAVVDCAYGPDDTPHAAACDRLVAETERMLRTHSLLLFPVPKYGRGLEILKLFSGRLKNVCYYADELFLASLAGQRAGGFWYRPAQINAGVEPYGGQKRGIVFVSDPQLRSSVARSVAETVLSLGGMSVMTGAVEKHSYSERLLKQGGMRFLRYPVHLNLAQLEGLKGENSFKRTIPYHSEAFCENSQILF